MQDWEAIVLTLVEDHPGSTVDEMVERSGTPKTTIKRYADRLADKKRIRGVRRKNAAKFGAGPIEFYPLKEGESLPDWEDDAARARIAELDEIIDAGGIGRPGMAHGGLAKLSEECGELSQVIGKMLAFGSGDHPDGKGPLIHRLEEEAGDVLGAIAFVKEKLVLDEVKIAERAKEKLELFERWDAYGK